MERKTFTVEIKDAEKGEVEAVFSTFNLIDHDGDVTVPGAFEDGAEVIISAYGHSSWHGELPVGKGTIKQTTKDARLLGQFFLDTVGGKETFSVVKQLGKKQEWSYGFDIKGTGAVDELPENLRQAERVLTKLHVFEVSPVLVGAGVDTRTERVKGYEPTTWTLKAADGTELTWRAGAMPVKAEVKGSPKPEPETTDWMTQELKQEGFVVQTLIFPKDKWDSLDAAKAWADDHDFETDGVDETETSWRFRQRDPDDFERLRTLCINPGPDASADDCLVQAVGGPVVTEEQRARAIEAQKMQDVLRTEYGRLERTRKKFAP